MAYYEKEAANIQARLEQKRAAIVALAAAEDFQKARTERAAMLQDAEQHHTDMSSLYESLLSSSMLEDARRIGRILAAVKYFIQELAPAAASRRRDVLLATATSP